MRTKYLITLFVMLLVLVVTVQAQPLPPMSPSGRPVPVGDFIGLLLLGGGVLLWGKSKKEQ